MKKLLILSLILMSFSAYAQEYRRNSFGLTAGTGSARVVRASLAGAPSLELQTNFELGGNYYRQIGEKLKFESGLFYHYNKLTVKPTIHPDVPQIATHYDIHLIYMPAFLRLNLSRHFFINGGGMVDLDLSNPLGISSSKPMNSQSGLGLGLGIGGEFPVLSNFYLQVNPYLNLHGVLLVKGENYPERIMDAGIKIGIRTK